MRVRNLRREDPLEDDMATYSSILALRIPWTEEAGELHTIHRVTKRQTQLKRLGTQHVAVNIVRPCLHKLCEDASVTSLNEQ